MGILDSIKPAPRRQRNVFLVVDTNERLGGYLQTKIANFIEEIVRSIHDVDVYSDDVEVKIAMLQFGGCKWVTSEEEPVSLEDFFLKQREQCDMEGFGQALIELDTKLSRTGFLKADYGCYTPVIIFIGSGYVAEDIDREIERINSNNWFKHAIKIAVRTNMNADIDLFTKLTGNIETILDIDDRNILKMIAKCISYDDFVS